jgi:Predicted membrane protein
VNTGIRPLAWSAAALILLFLTAVPLLNLPAVFLLGVPFTVLYVLLTPISFAVHAVAILSAALLIFGPVILFVGLFFLVPAVVMGHLYKRRAPARTVLTAGGVSILGLFLLEMLLFSVLLDIQLTAELAELIRGNAETMAAQGVLPAGWNAEATEALIASSIRSLPLTLMLAALMLVVITHWLARRALARMGVDVPAFRKAREWMLPRGLVYAYLAVIVLQWIVPEGDNSYFGTAVVNLYLLLRFAFTVQTIGFFFFLAYQKGWPRIVPLIISVPVLLFPPLSLIGVFDTVFPLRKSIGKS